VVSIVEEHYKVRISRCPVSGVIVEEEWKNQNGLLHRIDGPALIERNRDVDVETHRAFWLNGQRHRSHGKPALLEFGQSSGLLFRRVWLEHGKFVRPDNLPHVEWLDEETGIVVRAEYRIKNNTKYGSSLHRENGPALLKFDRVSGDQTGAEFYRFGRKQKTSSISKPVP